MTMSMNDIARKLTGVQTDEQLHDSKLLDDEDFLFISGVVAAFFDEDDFEELTHRFADCTTQPTILFQKLLPLSINVRHTTKGNWMLVEGWNPIFGGWCMLWCKEEQTSSGIFYQPDKL